MQHYDGKQSQKSYSIGIFNNDSQCNFLLQAGTFECKVTVVLEAAQGLEVGLHDCIRSQFLMHRTFSNYKARHKMPEASEDHNHWKAC
ncbi:hypothetical protein EK904_001290 [Melospiza melodia maxima]|nr:hypothetical protein EK904_001290 [Melospiza melodia maxima]